MKIKKIKINSLKNYLLGINENEHFYIGLTISEENRNKIISIGFSDKLEIGEKILPPMIGNISDFNSNGSFIKRKDLPKETAYREQKIKDWHGNTHFVDIPFKRYQREPILAPEIELLITEEDNKKLLISPEFINSIKGLEYVKHTINLFLEIFGECEVLKKDFSPSINNVKRLNWNILPQGRFPWISLKNDIEQILNRYSFSDNKKQQIKQRIRLLNDYTPDFVAIGNAGFQGYIIFGFKQKEIYILESIYSGNATYVLDNNWKELSQLTKKEILDDNLQKERVIHRKNWEKEIQKILG